MSDPLAASALLMAILAILFSVWGGDVAKVLDLSFALAIANRGNQRRSVILALLTKAGPLTLAAWASFLVFAGRAITIISTAVPKPASDTFDDVAAAFVISEMLVLAIAISATVQVVQLTMKWAASFRA